MNINHKLDPRYDDPVTVWQEFNKIISPMDQQNIAHAAIMAHENRPETAEMHRKLANYGDLGGE